MAVLFISDRVEAELDELWEASQDDAALFLVLMETLQDEPHIIEILNRPRVHHAHKPTFEIKQFAAMQRRGKNVLIIKVWSEQGQLSPFRGFLAHDSQRDEYSLLMVVNRDISYDTSDPNYLELNQRYDAIGIRDFRVR